MPKKKGLIAMNMDTISLTGLNPAAVFAALYNASRPIGFGYLHYEPEPMTIEGAAKILDEAEKQKKTLWIEYYKGRVMKIDLSRGIWDPKGYNEVNGAGAAQKVIEKLRESTTNSSSSDEL